MQISITNIDYYLTHESTLITDVFMDELFLTWNKKSSSSGNEFNYKKFVAWMVMLIYFFGDISAGLKFDLFHTKLLNNLKY